jgi:hypothetical protein
MEPWWCFRLFALVNIRYLWETGARLKTEGDTLVVTATFPVPSVGLKSADARQTTRYRLQNNNVR